MGAGQALLTSRKPGNCWKSMASIELLVVVGRFCTNRILFAGTVSWPVGPACKAHCKTLRAQAPTLGFHQCHFAMAACLYVRKNPPHHQQLTGIAMNGKHCTLPMTKHINRRQTAKDCKCMVNCHPAIHQTCIMAASPAGAAALVLLLFISRSGQSQQRVSP